MVTGDDEELTSWDLLCRSTTMWQSSWKENSVKLSFTECGSRCRTSSSTSRSRTFRRCTPASNTPFVWDRVQVWSINWISSISSVVYLLMFVSSNEGCSGSTVIPTTPLWFVDQRELGGVLKRYCWLWEATPVAGRRPSYVLSCELSLDRFVSELGMNKNINANQFTSVYVWCLSRFQ